MSVTSVGKDSEALTMTITAEYAAPIERVWDLWADPRKLERWWGPPTYPATFVDHDLTPGVLRRASLANMWNGIFGAIRLGQSHEDPLVAGVVGH